MEKDIQRINIYTAIEQMKRLSQEGKHFPSLSANMTASDTAAGIR